MLISQKARSIVPYTAGEQAEGFIKLNTNENPYPPSPAVAAAIRAFDTDTLRLYPSPDSAKLRQAIAAAEHVSPDNVFVGNGSDEVLALAFAALFDPDKPIEFADVTYSFYPVFARLFDIPYRTVPLEGDFTLPLPLFPDAATTHIPFFTSVSAPIQRGSRASGSAPKDIHTTSIFCFFLLSSIHCIPSKILNAPATPFSFIAFTDIRFAPLANPDTFFADIIPEPSATPATKVP